jgi:predicted nucleic acid-binding protein
LTLVDTNVLVDILGDDPDWRERSIQSLAERESLGPLAINQIIYAELAAGFTTQSRLDDEIEAMRLIIAPMSKSALFLAGQAFRRYRKSGGARANVLADFFIGAQASAEGWPLLTRDTRLYRKYFPDVATLSP